MATPAYSSHAQTRQQLDELDSLLQRMLTLPMSSAEPAAPPKPTIGALSPEAFAPLPPTIKSFPARPAPNGEHVLQAWRMESPPTIPEAIPVAAPVSFPRPPLPSAPPPAAPYPYSMVFGQPLPNEAPPPVEPLKFAPPPTSSTTAPVPFWQANASKSAPPPDSIFLFPIVALNWTFDILTYLLGPFGKWLRHPAGRSAMGWLGIVMLIGAIGWGLADWFGVDWTH